MASCAQVSLVNFSPLSEALAILRGPGFAIDSGLWPCVVESDSQTVVSMINSGSAPLSDIGLIIEDILDLLKGPLICSVNFISRKANLAAHCLAKHGVVSDLIVFGWRMFHQV
ncbi:hypothetical protein Ddye_012363 [Dipteronia dyeriana]|uniref:RNase H type-1 domain-containing protein n=1 Tax=Dipteronia dyeriana TaxID=168575 RepID=A0AAD9X4H1_9ROSI|nr:hypothetical protein Ddye_012334 [Dipteronia dyeriana]KAK2652507.1 hypothetical protein Ddye_012363 [Dipteronia dyeriana]